MRNSRNVWKLSACANSGYTRPFSPIIQMGLGMKLRINNYVSNSDSERMRKSWCSIFYPQFQIEVQATMHTIVPWSATGWSTLCVHLTHKVANRKHSFKYSGLLLYLAHYAMLFWTSTMNSKMPWSANSKYTWRKIEPLALESIPDCNQHHKWQ